MLTLTLIESSFYPVSGIPEYIELETNLDSVIYYTLDGTTPSSESIIADGKIYLPTNSGTVQLSAIAISESSSSEVLSHTYSSDSAGLNGPRRIGEEGIFVMLYDSDSEDSLSVNLSGESAQNASSSFEEYEMKASTTNSDGSKISSGGTSLSFVNMQGTTLTDDSFATSQVNNNSLFDPKAKVIIIDGSSDELFENQVVKIVNRTYNSFDPVTNFYTERLGVSNPIITGNYVRSFYNKKTNEYISYYWESLESRWIISKQTVEISASSSHPSSKNKFVFRWIPDRWMSSALV